MRWQPVTLRVPSRTFRESVTSINVNVPANTLAGLKTTRATYDTNDVTMDEICTNRVFLVPIHLAVRPVSRYGRPQAMSPLRPRLAQVP